MKTIFVVLLWNQSGNGLIPMLSDDEDMLIFDNREAAHIAAKQTEFGNNFGYEIIELPA